MQASKGKLTTTKGIPTPPQNGMLEAVKRSSTKTRKWDTFVYKIADFFSAMLGWLIFFIYRKYLEGNVIDVSLLNDQNFWFGIIAIPIGWILLYAIFDIYHDIYRISRMEAFLRTFLLSFIGVLFIFFYVVVGRYCGKLSNLLSFFFGLVCGTFFIDAYLEDDFTNQSFYPIKVRIDYLQYAYRWRQSKCLGFI